MHEPSTRTLAKGNHDDSWTEIQRCKIFSIFDGNIAAIDLCCDLTFKPEKLELISFSDQIILSFKRYWFKECTF